MRQGNIHDTSQNTKGKQQPGGETIDTCTMDPCAMKTESKNSTAAKCPECGKTDVPGEVEKKQDRHLH